MSFPSNLSLLIEQRQALQDAMLAFKQCCQFIEQRNVLEQAILDLQQEMDQDFHRFHQQGGKNPTDLSSFKEKKEHLQHLQNRQRQIDYFIDQTEDLTEDNLTQQRYQLLVNLWQLSPDKQTEQQPKWKEIQQLSDLEIEINHVIKIFNRLFEQFRLAIQARQSIKGRGILNYIFGTSPNTIIEQQLVGAHTLIINALPLIEKSIHKSLWIPNLYNLLKTIYIFLEEIKSPCHSPWSFHHIDTIFARAYQNISYFLEMLNKQQQDFLERKQKLEIEIEVSIQQL